MENDFNYSDDSDFNYQNESLGYQQSNQQTGYAGTSETEEEAKERIKQKKLKEYKAEKQTRINQKLIESQQIINQAKSKIKSKSIIKIGIIVVLVIFVIWLGSNAFESLSNSISTSHSTTSTTTFSLNPFPEGFSLNPRYNEAFKNTIKLSGIFLGLIIIIFILLDRTKSQNNNDN